ncbi:MAG: hypothetical protein KKB39_00290 [Nanoarchaeota archaeon]|nr:hypothetical protein [Nanoarchaeota archaeon]
MKLDINLKINENFKSNNIILHFRLLNQDKLDPETVRKACKYFGAGWSGLEQGFEIGENLEKLYKPAAKRLAEFFRELSEKPGAPIHYYLSSDNDEEVHGICAMKQHYKSTFTRNLTADELRIMGQEVKNALEGL